MDLYVLFIKRAKTGTDDHRVRYNGIVKYIFCVAFDNIITHMLTHSTNKNIITWLL